MLPLRLSLQGFLSYREEQTIDFTGSSLWMLWGPNGVGKSAIFDAITFALYNTHRAVVGSSYNLADLMNHHSDKLIVVFDFLMSGEIYRIRRTCTRGRGRTISSTREAFLLQGDDLANLEQMPATPIPNTDSETGFQKWIRQTIGLNYEAFVSSVLLLQGKSERLLEANAEKRYTTLAELIDLSYYQKLHTIAEKRCSEARASANTLAKQLQGITPITDDTLALAQATADTKSEVLVKAQQRVEHLTALLEQAKQWEAGIAQLGVQKKKLQETLDLLQRAEEIRNQFARLELLKRIIPDLEHILSQRERLEQKEKEILALEGTLEQKQQTLSKAAVKKAEAEAQMAEVASLLSDLLRRKDLAQRRLLELAPLVSSFRQIEKLQQDLKKINMDVSLFPPDIEQQLAECEHQDELVNEKAQVLPWLKSFAQARTNFADGLKQEERINNQLAELEKQRQQLCEQLNQRQAELAGADDAERHLREQKALTEHKLKDAKQRLKKFSEASTQVKCSLCGQNISREHASAESQRLQDEIETAKATSEQLSISYEKAHTTQQRLKDECTKLADQLADLATIIQKQKISWQAIQTRMEQDAERMHSAFANISPTFQQSICVVVPIQDQDWLATHYPSQADLEALQHEVSSRDAQKRLLAKLHAQHQSMQKLIHNQTLIEQQLKPLLAEIDLDAARDACLEQQTIEANMKALTVEIHQRQEEQEAKKLLAQGAEKTYNELNTSVYQTSTQLAAAKTARDMLHETLQHMLNALPPDWQEVAKSLQADKLRNLVHERDTLALYKDLHQQLMLANHAKETHEQRIQELQGALDKIPREAQRSQHAVQQDLELSKARRDQAERENNEARSHLAHLQQQQKHYLDIECRKMEAERQHHLYGLLVNLLGRTGLQLHLLRQAEHKIIELANKTLAGLSHHRLRLELRGESNTSAQAEKALDLVVYDYDTSQFALPVNQVSGSQRFRIAVSLALAIGRYTRHEVRQIKSVIIDEGFGSLDKTGRDDMIRELTALGQELELERIILVSHQDEFAAAFPNRYSFKLVDKASRVTLFSDD
jgi:exonuclease SbcC